MFGWIVDAIWTLLKTLGGWLLDLLFWVLEFVFDIANMFFGWIVDLVVGLAKSVFNAIADKLPAGLVETVTDAYAWLEYIDEWFPLSFGIKLFVAYYAIKLTLNVIKWVLKAIPTVWG